MSMSKIKKNDMVIILSGEQKGKVGAVLATNYKKELVTVKGINIKVKHHKPTQENQEGKIEKKEFPIHISKVAYMVKKGDAFGKGAMHSKIGWKTNKSGIKERFLRKTNRIIGDK